MLERVPPTFKLKFPPEEIPSRANEYLARTVPTGDYRGLTWREFDDMAAGAGRRLACGEFKADDFRLIGNWKSPRSKPLIASNVDDEIAEAVELAMRADKPRNAVAVLCGLNGVGVPVASAILAMIRPREFTVIDTFALKSLSNTDEKKGNIDFFLHYLMHCKELAAANCVDLRTLDRALFQAGSDPKT